MSSNIIDFWKDHREYWITHPSKHSEVDKVICDTFWTYMWTSENLIGQIIYLDQFSRHFARAGLLTEAEVFTRRRIIVDIIKHHLDSLKGMDEIEIVFALMPFKHLNKYEFIFEYLHGEWLLSAAPLSAAPLSAAPLSRSICDFPDLQRFYIDTYKKAFTPEIVRFGIISTHTLTPYDSSLICDYYPDTYTSDSWFDSAMNLSSATIQKLIGLLPSNTGKVTVSLSGGVDSMVMLLLLKRSGVNVSAVHIVYGNRLESEHEYNFLVNFCYKLGVPLFVYRIKWLRRGGVDREFYEDMTRDLRFYAYRAVGALINVVEEPRILMGHIREDVVENIWTNIANCRHLTNLKKMGAEEIQEGVRIMRPLLNASKEDIYEVSQLLSIPYLSNTTPSWSNRGKFREHFHGAVIKQFGNGVDDKIIEFAEAVERQSKLLDLLLYEPIYNSFKDNCVDITTGLKSRIDANLWLKVFEYVCHMKLGVGRPSIKCMRHFCTRLYSDWNNELKLDMCDDLKIKIRVVGDRYMMEFISC